MDKIDSMQNSTKISLGSLVQTNGMLLYVSTALPKITIEEKTILAVSPQSPLGSQILGKEVGYSFEIQGNKYVIETII